MRPETLLIAFFSGILLAGCGSSRSKDDFTAMDIPQANTKDCEKKTTRDAAKRAFSRFFLGTDIESCAPDDKIDWQKEWEKANDMGEGAWSLISPGWWIKFAVKTIGMGLVGKKTQLRCGDYISPKQQGSYMVKKQDHVNLCLEREGDNSPSNPLDIIDILFYGSSKRNSARCTLHFDAYQTIMIRNKSIICIYTEEAHSVGDIVSITGRQMRPPSYGRTYSKWW